MLIAEAEDDAESEQVIPAARRQAIGIALRSYAGPLTKNGLPKRKHLNDHAGFKIAGWEKRECWRRRKVAKKKPAKKLEGATRGSGVSITLPTEPLAGAPKTAPIMAVMVQDDGVSLLEYEVKEGQSIEFRVGGTIKAFHGAGWGCAG